MIKKIVYVCISLITAIPCYLLLQVPEGSKVSLWVFFTVMTCVIISISSFCLFLDSFSTIRRFFDKKKTISKELKKRKKRQYTLLFVFGSIGFGLYWILMTFYYHPILDGGIGYCIVCFTALCIVFGSIGSIRYNNRIGEYCKSFIKVIILGDSFYYEAVDEENCKETVKK